MRYKKYAKQRSSVYSFTEKYSKIWLSSKDSHFSHDPFNCAIFATLTHIVFFSRLLSRLLKHNCFFYQKSCKLISDHVPTHFLEFRAYGITLTKQKYFETNLIKIPNNQNGASRSASDRHIVHL